MADEVVTEFSIWSPFRIDWAAAGNRILAILSKLAILTVPAIGWNPIRGVLTPKTANSGTLAITWQAAGSPALMAALIPLLPAIFSILKTLIIGILVVTGIKAFTKAGEVTAGASETKASVIQSIATDDSLTEQTKQAALAAVAGLETKPSTLADVQGIIKTAVAAGVIIVGLLLILEIARGMRRRG